MKKNAPPAIIVRAVHKIPICVERIIQSPPAALPLRKQNMKHLKAVKLASMRAAKRINRAGV